MNPNELITAIEIAKKHMSKEDLEEPFICCAEHDQIFINLNVKQVPEYSRDGKKLLELGFFTSEDAWSHFV